MPNRASAMTYCMPLSHGVSCLGVPFSCEHVKFIELPLAAGYGIALIGKSHLQNMNENPALYKMPVYREGYITPKKIWRLSHELILTQVSTNMSIHHPTGRIICQFYFHIMASTTLTT